jgi:16S rRNA processing protein RimM
MAEEPVATVAAPGTERLVVALVRGLHGLRGTVRVETLTDRPEDRFRPGTVLYREGSDDPLTIAAAEAVQDGPGWRLRFREIVSREGADTLRSAYLETIVRPTADLARGEVYWHEVLDVPVRGLDGTELGVVQDVYRVAENEVYVVGGGAFGTWDLPAVRAFIRIFAPRRGEIVVDAEALDLQPPTTRPDGANRKRAPRRTAPHRRRPAIDTTSESTATEPGPIDPTPASAAGAPGSIDTTPEAIAATSGLAADPYSADGPVSDPAPSRSIAAALAESAGPDRS